MDTPTREDCLQNAAAHISASRGRPEEDGSADRHIRRAAVYAEMAKSAPTEPAPAPQDDAVALLVALVSEVQSLLNKWDTDAFPTLREAFKPAETFVRAAAEKAGKP